MELRRRKRMGIITDRFIATLGKKFCQYLVCALVAGVDNNMIRLSLREKGPIFLSSGQIFTKVVDWEPCRKNSACFAVIKIQCSDVRKVGHGTVCLSAYSFCAIADILISLQLFRGYNQPALSTMVDSFCAVDCRPCRKYSADPA